MSSNERTSVRARSRSGVASALASRVSISLRRADSRTSASWISFAAFDTCADSGPPIAMQIDAMSTRTCKLLNRAAKAKVRAAREELPELGIDLFEVTAIDEDLARLAAGARRNEPLGFHHVHEPRGTAEANPQLPLQIRDRRLSAAHDNTRSLV